ncbi:MAG: glycoside hydrolase family 3 C-terminal domain-containing protein [Prevotellaceae bacterium]|jgi:beta-glucosidase|nr:glycoside hydrolase family 3 C-terminal domain-containing protein [Prevotellaceae bacterium]
MKVKQLSLVGLLLLTACNTSYKNNRLSPEERADDLIKQLTLEEKVQLMQDVSSEVERLGIQSYNWWNEALHGVARAGLATVFPQPIGMAASFDTTAVRRVFEAVSDEARAKHTFYASKGERQRYQGLTFWTPTINIYRDPRWGRGIETYGEDPFLTARMGVEVVKGLQGPEGDYDKLHACAKHFAVHSGPEWNRHEYNAENIPARDLYETYLPAFEALVKEARVQEVMCAYNRFEGDPCCGSNRLLTHILREEWGFDGIVVADCGAIADFYNDHGHHTHADAASASAAAVHSGTDLDCGSSYKALVESVQKGLIPEAEIDRSVKRLLKARFALGEMDKLDEVSWSKIPFSVVGSAPHDSLALDMARRSIVLLQNRNELLPLKPEGLRVAVMGPNANDSVMQWGNYNGMPPHTVTILQGIQAALGADKVIYEQGCPWVERSLIRSAFSQCKTPQGAGFSARYWNNTKREGEPVAVAQIATPFQFCTSGATVFAPGVNLTNFSATYHSTFTPNRSGEVVFELYTYGSGRLRIDGQEVKSFRNGHGARKSSYTLKAKAGEAYEVELEYEYLRSDAQLAFDLGFKEKVDIRRSVERVKEADVVVFVGGISPSLEGEEMGVDLPGFKRGDRTDIELPAVQRELIAALHRAGKRIVLVNCSGSPIGLVPESERCEAIVQAWYPGQAGGTAVADVLLGKYNPAGRLPVTFYRNVSQLPDFENYDMKGRTYRYLAQTPLFAFGHGLSYSNFVYGTPTLSADRFSAGGQLTLTVPLTNNSLREGDEVVQLYLRKEGDAGGPVKTLRAFRRVSVPAGESVNVLFPLGEKELEWWNEATNSVTLTPGNYTLLVGGSSAAEGQTLSLRIQ